MTQAHLGLYFTLEEAAKECGMAVATFRKYVYSKGLIEPIFTQDAIDAYIAGKSPAKAKSNGSMAESTMKRKIRQLEQKTASLETRIRNVEVNKE